MGNLRKTNNTKTKTKRRPPPQPPHKVLAHHPPFTNSPIVRGEESVRETFLPSFLGSSKTVAFVSGHAHGLEHFRRDGKEFLVSGGGGGPRPTVSSEQGCCFGRCNRRAPEGNDLFVGSWPRPFHFIKIEFGTSMDYINFSCVGLDASEGAVRTLDEWSVPLPPA